MAKGSRGPKSSPLGQPPPVLLSYYKTIRHYQTGKFTLAKYYQFYYCLYLLMEYHHMSTVYSHHFPFLLKASDTTPFHIQAEVTMKTNFFGTRDVCTELLPLMKPHGESNWSPDCSASGKIWAHLALVSSTGPLPLLLNFAGLHRVSTQPGVLHLRSLHTLPRSLALSVHLLFAQLALSSLSPLSSEVSSSKGPLTCSVPITGGVPSGVLPRPSLPCPPLTQASGACTTTSSLAHHPTTPYHNLSTA